MSRAHRWFPGYTVAAVSTVAYFCSAPGQTMIVSLFNTPIRDEFGIDVLELNGAYTLATVVASLPLVVVGALTDRVGPRRMLAIVALLFGLACLAMSAAQGIVTVFAGFLLLRLFGQGSLTLVSSHALAMWFHRRLGSVNGVKQVVVFAGWAVLPSAAAALIAAVGWRWSYVIFGLAVWALVIPLSLLFVRNRPEDLGLQTDNDGRPRKGADGPPARAEASFTLSEALRTPAYWTLAVSSILPPLIGTAMLFDIQPILAERQIDTAAAPLAVGAWSAVTAVMAIPSGVLTDRAPPGLLIALGLLGVAASTLMLLFASSPAMAIAAFAVYAVGGSLGAASAAATVARYFGRLHHGAIRSSLTRLMVIGTGLGPLATGLSASFAGGYGPALGLFAIACVPMVLAGATLRPPREPARAG